MTDSGGTGTATLRVGAVQMTSTEDVDRNLETARKLVRRAVVAGATLVGLPENFAFLGSDQDHRLAIAESLDDGAARPGPIRGAMAALARETGAHLLLGGFPERTPTGDRIRNTAVLLSASGQVSAVYRKIHLFDVDLPGAVDLPAARFRESESVEAGGEVVVAPFAWGGLGLSICYDLRFPELYRRLTAAGARVLAVPAAFTAETGKDHWHALLRARAIENQAYVVAPAQFGAHGGQRRSYGHALVVDPWGTILAECGDHEGVSIADLDFGYQDQVRSRLPCLDHRRLKE